MNGLDLATPPQLQLPRGNGHKSLTPGEEVVLSGLLVSFEEGLSNARMFPDIYKGTNDDIRCTFHVIVGEEKLAASIRDMRKAAVTTAWIRVSGRSPGFFDWTSQTHTNMEVIVGHQVPPLKEGFQTYALIKITDREAQSNYSDSDDEEPEEFQIFVKHFNGKSFTFTVQPDMLVKKLKLEIQKALQIPPDQQRLLYAGKQLEDDKSLAFYGIKANATLNMVSRLRGG